MSNLEEKPRGLTNPAMAAEILKAIPAQPLDTQRKMGYFVTPRWKRLTEYEALTLYAQPNPDWIAGGLDWGDWTQKYHGGRPSWGNENTEVRTSDWFRHRDPNRRWHAPYVKDKAEEWRYTDRFLTAYAADGQIRTMDAHWRDDILNTLWGGFLFSEYALFNANSSVVREALSDVTRVSGTLCAFDKVDNAQMIQLVRVFLSKIVPGFPESTDGPKKEWTSGAIYKGAREVVQDIWQDTYDWVESMFSVHLVYDALFGQFVRREFFLRLAPRFGDTLSPFFMNQSQTYFQITKTTMSDLFITTLADDPEFADYNRRLFQIWAGKWVGRTTEALRDFMGAFQLLPKGSWDRTDVQASVARVVDDWIEDYANRIGYKADRNAMINTVMSGLK